jgi:hypothetical protein
VHDDGGDPQGPGIRVAALLSATCAVLAVRQSGSAPRFGKFEQIDVQRINVLEPDGKPRVIISNRSHRRDGTRTCKRREVRIRHGRKPRAPRQRWARARTAGARRILAARRNPGGYGLSMQSRINRFLLAYALIVSTIAAGTVVSQAISAQDKVAFDEIDVQRINVREADGTLRMVISNKQRFPGIIVKGKEQPHPNRRTAGMLFFNEEGTENGGLTFDGSKRDGKVSSSGHLSFDRYEQDQVIEFSQDEDRDSRSAALIVSDRPDKTMDFAGMAKVTAMPAGAARDKAMQQLVEGGTLGLQTRVQVGRWRDRSSGLVLHDAAGMPRLQLEVTAEGAAAIKFFDDKGKVVRTVTP